MLWVTIQTFTNYVRDRGYFVKMAAVLTLRPLYGNIDYCNNYWNWQRSVDAIGIEYMRIK